MIFSKRPKAVFFDFGGTLIENGEMDALRGFEGLRLQAKNPGAASAEMLKGLWDELCQRVRTSKRSSKGVPGLETPLSALLRNVLAKSGLEFSFDITQCGIVFDTGNFPDRAPATGMAELLCLLEKLKIKTGVISNTTMSGEEMLAAVNAHLPENKFEFVLTSCDYLLTKPETDMFEIAALKTGLLPEECLYCGDSFINDVTGSLNAGMNAVLYDTESKTPVREEEHNNRKYLIINSWKELLSIMERVDV